MENTYIPELLDGWDLVLQRGLVLLGSALEPVLSFYRYRMESWVAVSGMGFLNMLSITILAGSFPMFLLPRSETGEYLALDLGGTNFRVLLITMKEGRMVDEVKLFSLYLEYF